MFLLRKRFWIGVLKAAFLLFVGIMAVTQIPELLYDFGPRQPLAVESPEDLRPDRISGATFAAVSGSPDFSDAFVYQRYGLNHTYFTVSPYGNRLVVRTYGTIDEDWETIGRFLGRLRPFEEQPFSYRIRDIYQNQMGVEIPPDSYFLALDDVPSPSGWQLGALGFSVSLWLLMAYLFFLRRPRSI